MSEPENRKGKGIPLRIVELGLENRVYDEMKKPKFSVEALTRQLNEEGISITAQSIRKFIKKTKKAQQELISRDIQTASEVKRLTMDYTKSIKDILKEVEEVKNTAKDTKDYATYNQLVGRLLQGIELIAKLTEALKPKAPQTVDITIVHNEIKDNIEKELGSLKTSYFNKIIDVDAKIKEEDEVMAEKIQRSG